VLCINLSRVVDPDVIVFTGGLAKAGDVLLQLIEKHMKALAWTILPTNVKLLTAKSLEFGGMVGAALAAKQLLVKQVALRKAAEQAQEVSLAAGKDLCFLLLCEVFMTSVCLLLYLLFHASHFCF